MKTIENQETLICSFNPKTHILNIDVSRITEQYALIARDSSGIELVRIVVLTKKDLLKYPYGHNLSEVKVYLVAQEEVDVEFEIKEKEVEVENE